MRCWRGEHRTYAALALILLGFYIPLCAMIAPMFQEEFEFEEEAEDEEEEETEDDEPKKGCCGCCKKKKKKEEDQKPSEPPSALKQFLSFSNTIAFVAPYLSAFTVAECFMLIATEFVSKGGELGTVVAQCVSMALLIWFTFSWALRDLNAYGLTQNEPVFPFGVSMLKTMAFVCGVLGCALEVLRFVRLIDIALELFLLAVLVAALALCAALLFLRYHSFFNALDDDLDTALFVKVDKLKNNALSIFELDRAAAVPIAGELNSTKSDKQPTSKRLKPSSNAAETDREEALLIPKTIGEKEARSIRLQMAGQQATTTTDYLD
jgi:hypothetical protein